MKVVLDIETIQVPKEEWARLKGVTLLQEEAVDLLAAGEASEQDKEYEKSCFDSTFCRIVCIGLIVLTDAMEPQEAIAWFGSNEPELLRQFWGRIAQIKPTVYIVHNGLGFDLPVIRNRSIIHQIKPTVEISLARYRTEPVFDTLAVWSNWEARGRVKLDVLARVLECATKSGEGGQVAEMWKTGQGKQIAEYCLRDCYVTYACYAKMNFRQPLPPEKILFNMNLIELGGQPPFQAE
jgi:DNA polymerase elongation subunit (family B)